MDWLLRLNKSVSVEHFSVIFHVDMDAFFASVEQKDNPSYRDRPLIVGADPKGGRGRGVVSTCSYQARAFGIHSAMPISIAYKLCPQAVFVPVRMERYQQVSRQLYQIFDAFTPVHEVVSIDEAFLDMTSTMHRYASSLHAARSLKECILKKLGLTASLGIAPTKMAAKIASDLQKPDGLVEVVPQDLLKFLWPLPVTKLCGLGKKTEEVLRRMGVATIGALARYDLKVLQRLFGKNGNYFFELAWGRDAHQVEENATTKSISSEVTFERDTRDGDLLRKTLFSLCEDVSERLRHEQIVGRTLVVKVRFSDFTTTTKSVTLAFSTNFVDILFRHAVALFQHIDQAGMIRLLGIKISRLSGQKESETIFWQEEKRRENLHRAVEKIRSKLGRQAIFRASCGINHEN